MRSVTTLIHRLMCDLTQNKRGESEIEEEEKDTIEISEVAVKSRMELASDFL